MYLINTSTATSNNTVFTFSSIPQTFTHLRMICYLRTSQAGAGANAGVWLNNDQSGIYRVHYTGGDGGSIFSGDFAANQTSFNIGWVGNTAATAGLFSTHIVDILDYTDTSKFKTIRTINGFDANNSTTNLVGLWSGLWRSTSAINRIDIPIGFATGSTVSLYGISNSTVTGV